ncbi:MAG: FAD/NAD(P)-binding protein [Myxococcota bacterium]
MLDWVIVGGGPHGVCAARALVAHGASLRIVEPSGQLLHRWLARAEAVAMTWMRSPVAHHLDAHPSSLDHFLHRGENADVAGLAGTFRRPTHAAFLRHTRELIAQHRLDESVVRGRVESIRAQSHHLVVEGEGVELLTRRVLVATGSNAPRVPPWAQRLRQEGAPVHHVFEGDATSDLDIVGGGISAVQRALRVHRDTRQRVRLWMRRPVHEADFDYDRTWAQHRFVARWSALDDAERLAFFGRNPSRGSVPAGLAARLRKAVRRGSIHVEYGIPTIEWNAGGRRLVLRGPQKAVESSGLTLATGLNPETVTGWLRSSAANLGLPVVEGLARLEHDMHWGRGVYVCGPLARLRLGPMASNVIGARWATAKLPGVRMQPR